MFSEPEIHVATHFPRSPALNSWWDQATQLHVHVWIAELDKLLKIMVGMQPTLDRLPDYLEAVTDGFCDQGLPGACMVGVTTVVLERGVGVVIVVTLPVPWMACLRVYALVV